MSWRVTAPKVIGPGWSSRGSDGGSSFSMGWCPQPLPSGPGGRRQGCRCLHSHHVRSSSQPRKACSQKTHTHTHTALSHRRPHQTAGSSVSPAARSALRPVTPRCCRRPARTAGWQKTSRSRGPSRGRARKATRAPPASRLHSARRAEHTCKGKGEGRGKVNGQLGK
jgi:hypothetical protein